MASEFAVQSCPHPSREEREGRTRAVLEQLVAARTDGRASRVGELIDRLIRDHLDVAANLARRYHRRQVEDDDLRQVALVGLTKAARNWDAGPEQGFLPYAVPMIDGELRRYLRDLAKPIRLPRRLHQATPAVVTAEREIEASGRTASDREIADVVGLPVGLVHEQRKAQSIVNPASLTVTGDGAIGSIASEAAMAAAEYRVVLARAIAGLPARERAIIGLRFIDELSQAEIGRIIGVSQMHVSRLLARSLQALKLAIDPRLEGWPGVA